MSGMVERRNQREWWTGRITWNRLKQKTLPACDDCVLNAHETRGEAAGVVVSIAKARYRRKNARQTGTFGMEAGFKATVLCDVHRQEWLTWTPGQMVLPRGQA